MTAVRYSPLFLVAVLLVALFGFLGWLVGRWNTPFEKLGLNPLLRGLLQQFIRSALALVGVLLALDLLGATAVVTAVLGTAGLAGLAVGFAFRDIVENYLAGVLLSLRQPFAVGDYLLLASYEGRVVRLTSRELVLMTLDGNHVRIPNATVFGSVTTNFSRNPLRRFGFEFVVASHEDITAVHELCVRALHALPGVLAEPRPQARPLDLEGGVRFGVLGWVDQRQTDFRKVQAEAIRAVKEALEGAGVETPESVVQVKLRRAAAEPTPKHEPAKPRPHVRGVDVSLDRDLDAQLAEELTDPDEPNLLEAPRSPLRQR